MHVFISFSLKFDFEATQNFYDHHSTVLIRPFTKYQCNNTILLSTLFPFQRSNYSDVVHRTQSIQIHQFSINKINMIFTLRVSTTQNSLMSRCHVTQWQNLSNGHHCMYRAVAFTDTVRTFINHETKVNAQHQSVLFDVYSVCARKTNKRACVYCLLP